MNKTIVTYETHHNSAKKVALKIAENLNCDYVDIDTPALVEDLSIFENIIIVFAFRGPYTAQLTKLYLNRTKEQFKNKNVILVGEGLFSEKEFPLVAEDIHKMLKCNTFNKFFIKGQLRVNELSKEEKYLLGKFSEITGIKIVDMGELDINSVDNITNEIETIIKNNPVKEITDESDKEIYEWVCPLCGYVHKGKNPPEVCPLCGAKGETFIKR